jgi:hypothetical protein
MTLQAPSPSEHKAPPAGRIRAAARRFVRGLAADQMLEHVGRIESLVAAPPAPEASQAVIVGLAGLAPFDPARDLIFTGGESGGPAVRLTAFDRTGRVLQRVELSAP